VLGAFRDDPRFILFLKHRPGPGPGGGRPVRSPAFRSYPWRPNLAFSLFSRPGQRRPARPKPDPWPGLCLYQPGGRFLGGAFSLSGPSGSDFDGNQRERQYKVKIKMSFDKERRRSERSQNQRSPTCQTRYFRL
jgi:hypothetical protein